MTIDLTAETTLNLLREVVRVHGKDYVYDRGQNPWSECVYVHGTDDVMDGYDDDGDPMYVEEQVGELKPGCIVGHVLHRAGVPLSTFLELHINRDTSATMALEQLEHAGVIQVHRDVDLMLSSAQDVQDSGDTWGEALWRAEGWIPSDASE